MTTKKAVKAKKVVKVVKKKQKPFSTKAPLPKLMKVSKINWLDVQDIAQHCVNLLEEDGETMLDVVRNCMKLIRAVSERDYADIFRDLSEIRVDVAKVIQDIRTEFNITD